MLSSRAPAIAPSSTRTNDLIGAWAAWYQAMGVLDAVETPGATPPAPSLLAEPPAVASARTLARACRSLDDLALALGTFDGCPLKATATRLCLADGNPAAKLMLIGEAPGVEEDRLGRPFVGPSGRLLDRMLATIGLDRRKVYITNLIYWRPPGTRDPTSIELATCLPFLERQIELVAPRLIVFVGGIAARVLLEVSEGVTKLRGRRFVYQPPGGAVAIPATVMFHPAYLLRQPLNKRLAWRDLLAIAAQLDALQADAQP
jgi:uracil-DNA glycosylase family 4